MVINKTGFTNKRFIKRWRLLVKFKSISGVWALVKQVADITRLVKWKRSQKSLEIVLTNTLTFYDKDPGMNFDKDDDEDLVLILSLIVTLERLFESLVMTL